MTDSEALGLKGGERVRTKVGRRDVFGAAHLTLRRGESHVAWRSHWHGGQLVMLIRRDGRQRDGRPFNRLRRLARDVDLIPGDAALTGNVFADFLEERGFAEAAACLRGAFPVAELSGGPQIAQEPV